MSLISDALRKARQEAAEREAKDQGLETPMVAGYWKRGGRHGVALILGAAIALGAALIGGGLMWWVLADRSDKVVIEVSDGVEKAAVSVIDSAPVHSTGDPAPDQGVEMILPAAVLAESTTAGDDGPAAVGGKAVSESDAIGRSPDGAGGLPAEAIPPPAKASEGDGAGGEFVAEARIGETTLILDYLVYRNENPFAQINGRDVRVGAVIEDFVVEAITSDSVVLTRGDTRVVIRVR